MTVTTLPAAPTSEQRDAARREAEVRALEAAIVAAAVVGLAARLDAVTASLRATWEILTLGGALTAAAAWATARRRAADQLTQIRPDIAGAAVRHLDRAGRLGADHAGVTVPAGWRPADDDTVREMLARADDRVTAKLARAADTLTAGPVDTPARLEDALSRVDAVQVEARSAVGDVVARAAAAGARAGAEQDGVALAWAPEPRACLNCAGMAGGTPRRDGLYRPVRILAPHPMPWLTDGVAGPPAHDHCRCSLIPAVGEAAAQARRDADTATAYGWSAYDSLPAMLAGVDALLRTTRLRPGTRRDAFHNLGMGRFVLSRPSPRTQRGGAAAA